MSEVNKKLPYDQITQRNLQALYMLAIFLWLMIVFNFGLFEANAVSICLILFPIAIFAMSLWNIDCVTVEVEEQLFAVSYISIGLLVIIPLVTWTHDKYGADAKVMDPMILAIIFAVASLVDVWVPLKWVTYIRHVRSILQVLSLTLIVYALYHIFIRRSLNGDSEEKENILPV